MIFRSNTDAAHAEEKTAASRRWPFKTGGFA